jgi:predicted CoA-binding protein
VTDEPRRIELIDEPASPEPLPLPLLDDAQALELLRAARRIAVVGASSLPWRASNSVMGYLLAHGYECVPVTPKRPEVLGRPCYDTLEAAVAATGAFDIVDVFRRPEHTPQIARSAVATGCGALWLQQGVISSEAVRIADAGGVAVVMDRCTAVMHRLLRA